MIPALNRAAKHKVQPGLFQNKIDNKNTKENGRILTKNRRIIDNVENEFSEIVSKRRHAAPSKTSM